MVTVEGAEVMKTGSHEARVYQAVDKDTGTLQADVMVRGPPPTHTHTTLVVLGA